MDELSQDVWKKYGLKANPFDTRALSLDADSLLPITEAFVGRGSHSRESMFITNILRNPGGASFVVEGPVGVGKTSFVNYHRALWERKAKDKILTPEEEIPVCKEWTLKEFLLNILGAVISRIQKLPSGETHIKADPTLQAIHLLSNVYQGKNYQYGANLFGIGGSIGKEESIHLPDVPEIQLTRYFRYLVRKIKELGFVGLFLHLDNLELLVRSRLEETQMFFENLRDTLQTPDVYFALVGYRGFFQDIIVPRERLKSIFFGRPIYIPPLSRDEVRSVIERRYALLKLPETPLVSPFETDFIDYLYDVYRGKIRFVMEAINTLVPFLSQGTPISLPSEEAKRKLQEILTEEVMATITPQEWEVLKIAAQQEYFTNKDIGQHLKVSPSGVTRLLKHLLECRLISQIRKESRYIYYQVSEDVRIILDKSTPHLIRPYEGEPLSHTKRRTEKALKLLKNKERFTSKEYASLMQVSIDTARDDLNYLVGCGKLDKSGKTKSTFYTCRAVQADYYQS